MKVFVTLTVLCFLQTIAGQANEDGHKLDQHNQGQHVSKPSQHQAPPHPNQLAGKEQHVAGESQHVAHHHTADVKSHHGSHHSNVKVPTKVQHIVKQVSHHIPQVISHHIASKKRVVRSVSNRQAWQTLQVNVNDNPAKCEFICRQEDVSVCGHNGRCYWEFESQCDLSTYNCLHTDKIFEVVDFAKCQDVSQPKCYRGDL